MKLQFSLATLMVCVTVLAAVSAAAVSVKVHEPKAERVFELLGASLWNVVEVPRAPNSSEILWREIAWGLPSVGTTLALLWIIRRLPEFVHRLGIKYSKRI